MGSLKTIALAGALLTGMTTLASAADLRGPLPMVLPPAPIAAPVVEQSGWYLRGDIGVAAVDARELSYSDKPANLTSAPRTSRRRCSAAWASATSTIAGCASTSPANSAARAASRSTTATRTPGGLQQSLCPRRRLRDLPQFRREHQPRQRLVHGAARQRLSRPRHLVRPDALRRRRRRRGAEQGRRRHGFRIRHQSRDRLDRCRQRRLQRHELVLRNGRKRHQDELRLGRDGRRRLRRGAEPEARARLPLPQPRQDHDRQLFLRRALHALLARREDARCARVPLRHALDARRAGLCRRRRPRRPIR